MNTHKLKMKKHAPNLPSSSVHYDPSSTVRYNSIKSSSSSHYFTMRGHLYKLITKRKWDSVIERILYFPDEAKQATQTLLCGTSVSCIPIHIACMCEPTLQVIAAFIAAAPRSLEDTDGIGRSALHIAIGYHASPQVITHIHF